MTFFDSWKAINAHIEGVEQAAELHSRFLQINSGSPYGADKYLQEQCEAILDQLKSFRSAYSSILPKQALASIDDCFAVGGKHIKDNSGKPDALLLRTILVMLSAFRARLSFHLADQGEQIRSRAELAFLHLQRLIAVDEDIRKKWENAFERGEVYCEALGAVHLLWHGIWAFKANAAGARTDLIYNEAPPQAVQTAAVGLALTEWKLVRASDTSSAKFAEAQQQAERYITGSLAGFELMSHRYLIAVSKEEISPPIDEEKNGVIYRHINTAVTPTIPSKIARSQH
jgi:hypothetical protein